MINDQVYYDELCKEIDDKKLKQLVLMQQLQLLNSLKKRVEQGETREEIISRLEHNPFDDFNFFSNNFNKRDTYE